jgi:ubiquinone/menaquinone biosynthesis C-methylase UbiE
MPKKQWNNITKNYKYSKAMEQGKNIFDDYAKNYQETMGECLKVTGYDSSYFTMTKIRKLRALNLENILKPIRILDFGCGVGNFSVGFKKYFPNSIYVGVDASSGMIREALNKYSEYGEFYEASSSEWGRGKYDIIFSSGTFHHILHDEHENILKELVSVLTSSGKIFIWEHNPINPITRKLVNDCPLDQDAILINPKKMKDMLCRVQLHSVKIIYTTFFPKCLSFLAPLESRLGWLPMGAQYIAIGKNLK